eukprot:350247-Chlamydomonas_euryale.AAC.7
MQCGSPVRPLPASEAAALERAVHAVIHNRAVRALAQRACEQLVPSAGATACLRHGRVRQLLVRPSRDAHKVEAVVALGQEEGLLCRGHLAQADRALVQCGDADAGASCLGCLERCDADAGAP